MALSDGGAEAQGSHHGYTYTERVCQEYGQQPRRYQVRDPIAGSDWCSDGGWAIVLERGWGLAAPLLRHSGAIMPSFRVRLPNSRRRR